MQQTKSPLLQPSPPFSITALLARILDYFLPIAFW